ncbi:MAG: GapR family DNA-binding domain-containing protein [Rhodospirillaceae bacterium]
MESMDNSAAEQLRSFIERIERLEEEKGNIASDIKDVYSEAKGTGFDAKAMRAVIRLRKKEAHEREEEEQLLELYRQAIGV